MDGEQKAVVTVAVTGIMVFFSFIAFIAHLGHETCVEALKAKAEVVIQAQVCR
jgi:hypothetical protein